MLVGHEHILGWLERELPQVTLLLGPESVGKRQLARHVFSNRGGVSLEVTHLDAEQARRVAKEALISPFGSRKNIIIGLDGASEAAQNILLKTLEEPPVTTRFILTSSAAPLPTISSRCARIHVGLLTREQVVQVLGMQGVSEEEARQAAPYGAGQVAPALRAIQEGESTRKARGIVSAALKAALSGEPGLLGATMRGWEPQHTVLLSRWAAEAVSGRWKLFDPSFAPGAERQHALSLLTWLSAYAGTRTGPAVALDKAFPCRT